MSDCNWSSGTNSQASSNWLVEVLPKLISKAAPPLKPSTQSDSTRCETVFDSDPGLYLNLDLDYSGLWMEKKRRRKKKNPVDWRVQIQIAAEPKLRLRYQDTSILLRSFVRKWRKFGPSSVTFLVMWHCSAMWSDCLPFGGFGLHRVRRTFIRITSKSSSLSPHRLIHLYCSLLNESWTSLSIINRWFSNISFDSIGTSAGYCYNENCITEKVQELAAFNEIQYLP